MTPREEMRETIIIAEYTGRGSGQVLLERYKGASDCFRVTTVRRYNSQAKAIDAFLSEIPASRREEYKIKIKYSQTPDDKKVLLSRRTPKDTPKPLKPAKKGKPANDKSKSTSA